MGGLGNQTPHPQQPHTAPHPPRYPATRNNHTLGPLLGCGGDTSRLWPGTPEGWSNRPTWGCLPNFFLFFIFYFVSFFSLFSFFFLSLIQTSSRNIISMIAFFTFSSSSSSFAPAPAPVPAPAWAPARANRRNR